MTTLAAIICLFAFHGGPADHFATFAENLTENGYEVQIFASGPALQKFQSRGIDVIQKEQINLTYRISSFFFSSTLELKVKTGMAKSSTIGLIRGWERVQKQLQLSNQTGLQMRFKS